MQVMGGGFSDVEPVAKFNQPCSVGHESGARLFFGSEREDQPCVVNCPGEVCEGWSDECVDWAVRAQASVSRADIALDLEPADKARGRMLELRRAFKTGRCETRVEKMEEARSDEGWTFYFGARSSDRRLRVYDQRGPLRLEWQWRPPRGVKRFVPKILKQDGVASLWRSMSKEIIFPSPWYRELLEGECASWSAEAERISTVKERIDQIRLQHGVELYALQVAGVKLAELVRRPGKWRRDDAAKYLRWAAELERLGYDGAKLGEEIRCTLKRPAE
jgi:hypothetical protein